MTYVVCGKWQVRAGTADEALAVMRELGKLSRQEPGCLMWEAHRSVEDPHTLLFYEQYRDEAAFTSHWESEHTQRLLPVALEFVLTRDRGRFTTVDL